MESLRFTIPETLSLFGLAQCLYLLVYMMIRAGDYRRAILPFSYFFILGCAFFLDFAARFIGDMLDYYIVLQWATWFMGPPLSVLLILQIAHISRTPSLRYFFVLLLIPLAWLVSLKMTPHAEDTSLHEWLIITGLFAGAFSLLVVWMQRGLLDQLYREKSGKERYWLVLTLIFMNVFFLLVMLASLTPFLPYDDAMLVRTVLGLGLIYLAGTSLFRIYPQAVEIVQHKKKNDNLSQEDKALAKRIESLLELDKVYQEPQYSRADLARELEISESQVSYIVNLYFQKTIPQLLNEYRVEDAKRLLAQTEASVKVVSHEVGFNSTASFNRIFRDLTGLTPTAYRNSIQKSA